MDHLDDLPKRHKNHVTETRAETAFEAFVSNSEHVVLQGRDRNDYGTDYQLEIVDRGRATNLRIHVQLKGTEQAASADGVVSVEIRRSNLNYLLMQPHSFFACYHVPSQAQYFCPAEAVAQKYEHGGQSWFHQQTLTVPFSEILTEARMKSLSELTYSSGTSMRNTRFVQTTARPEDLPGILKAAPPDLHVPYNEAQAAAVLSSLYDRGADEIISAAFEKFVSIVGGNPQAMTVCYMAEINLGMGGSIGNAGRIADGISHLTSQLSAGRYHASGLYYSIGNGFSALRRDVDAVKYYEIALEHLRDENDAQLLAQCYKNLGSSYERLGDQEKAVEQYLKALRYDDQLPEAHQALGCYFLKNGEYAQALQHLDQVVYTEHTLGKRTSVSGSRINAFFNLSDGKAAFREIGLLLGDAPDEVWIWPWCAQQVASFGRASKENAKLSIPFWLRYLEVHPNCPSGVRELLLCKLFLRAESQGSGLTYPVFKIEFDSRIQYVRGDEAAFLWDRLGHWAQDEDNWGEAERCFRIAYELAGGHYGYCFGTALNFLGRPDESLPILLAQAQEIQQDDMSWFQVAVAYEKLGRVPESIDAYQKAIALNPDYDLAWFNLGGVHWNAGEHKEASRVWKDAVERFPNHQLAALLRRDLPFFLR